MRPCLDCGALADGTRCHPCHLARERTRRPPTSQRYGGDYAANRKVVLERDGHLCQLRLEGCRGVATTVDHIVPRSKGGDHNLENLRAACAWCNTKRGARFFYRAQMRSVPPLAVSQCEPEPQGFDRRPS